MRFPPKNKDNSVRPILLTAKKVLLVAQTEEYSIYFKSIAC